MLERLDHIDWYALGHAYGDASDVPDLIRALTSPDRAVRARAWDAIFGSLPHQGDIYNSTPVAVPFLVELVADDSVPGRAELLQNLCYYSPDYPYWTPYYDAGWKESVGDERWTRRAIADGLPAYLRRLDDPDPEVRSWAACLLTVCITHRDAVARVLRGRLAAEPEASVRVVLALQVGVLNRPADARFLAGVARRDPDPVVRLAAALAWVHLRADRPPPAAVRLVTQLMEGPGDLRSRLPMTDFVVESAFRALGRQPGGGVRGLLALLRSPTVAVRKDALQTLAGLHPRPPAATAGLVGALSDPVADVRIWAAFLLGNLGDSAVMWAPVTKQYAQLEELEGQLDQPARAAVAGLAARLRVERDSQVRDTIWRALGDLALWADTVAPALSGRGHDARETRNLIAALQRADPADLCERLDDAHGKRAWMTGRALLRVARDRPQAVVPLLVERLGSFPAAVETAARLLGEIGPPAGSAVPALRRALGHSYEGARNAAAEALRRIEPAAPAGPAKPGVREIRSRLGPAAPGKLVGLVRTLLDDSRTGAQFKALWQISRMGVAARPALPFLHEAMQKDWLRHDAAGAIARLDPEAIRPLLPDLLRDLRESRLEGDFADRTLPFLAYLGPDLQPDAARFLLRCLPAPGRRPRPAAQMIPHALGYLGTAEPHVLLPLVVRLLRTRWGTEAGTLGPVPPVLRFLKKRGSPYAGAVHAVAEKLTNPDLTPLALETLSRIGTWTTAARHLIPFLASPDAAVRKAAEAGIRRLGKAATAADRPALRRSASHTSAVVPQSARQALDRLE